MTDGVKYIFTLAISSCHSVKCLFKSFASFSIIFLIFESLHFLRSWQFYFIIVYFKGIVLTFLPLDLGQYNLIHPEIF